MLNCNYFVYLLKSEVSNRFYVGYTVNLRKRIRQHNGEIKGGAKRTSRNRPWKAVMYVSGFKYERTAMQYEYMIQHPPKKLRKKGGGILKYMTIMKRLLQQEKICSTAPLNSELKLMKFFTNQEYYEIWKNI